MSTGKDITPFECTICGDCCTKFSIKVKPWVEDGVVHLVKDGSIGVEIWPWEARILAMMSEVAGASLILMPSNVMLDSKRDNAIVLSYIIANRDCPFVKDKKCSVYADRPNVCRYFPLVLARAGVRTSDRCPETITPKKRSSATENAEVLKRTYPDGVPYLKADLYIHERIIDLLGTLEQQGKVIWEWKPDPEKVLKKVQDQEWKDLLEYLVEIEAMTTKEVEELVKDMLSMEDIDDKVDFKLLTI
jgi:Fe-S-cluster containining protein